jgi:Nickel responsive protein SCO4226-like
VRFVRSVFIPEDETCLCVYEAASAEDVREAARHAGLPVAYVRGVIGEPIP